MKNLMKLFTLLLLCSFNLNAQDSTIANNSSTTTDTVDTQELESCTLTIEMTDLDSEEGEVLIAIYNTKGTWLGKNYKGKKTTVQNGKAMVTFTDIPYGTYAASAFHDKDMDGKLKTGIFGIPREPYASSRGAKARFGPPKWEDAKFTISEKSSKEIIKF